jgi:hypothetical protein
VNKMKKATLVILALAMLLPMAAMAQATSSGTLTVSATIQNSMYLTLESVAGGIVLGSGGTPAATMAFGTVAAYGGPSLPAGVTKALVASPAGFKLSTSFGVKVAQYNAATTNGYSLTAALQTSDSNTWAVDGKALTTTAQAITAGAQSDYNNAAPHSFDLTIPATENAGSISNTITLVATAL